MANDVEAGESLSSLLPTSIVSRRLPLRAARRARQAELSTGCGTCRRSMTGAGGYIGLHILRELLKAGHEVPAVVRSPEKLGLSRNILSAAPSALLASCFCYLKD
jgi:hypothetical protein